MVILMVVLILAFIAMFVFCLVEGILMTAELKLNLRDSIHRSGYKAIALMWFVLTVVCVTMAGFLTWIVVTHG